MKWLETWQGLCTAIVSAVAATVALLKLLPKLYGAAKKFYAGTEFLLTLESYLARIEKHLEDLDRGQTDLIGTRREIMAEDELRGWIECDAKGRWEFANRLVRAWMGLESDEITGNGWQGGIAEEDRHRVVLAWEDAVLRGRKFEEHCSLVDRVGRRTRIRLNATPLFDKTGAVISIKGRAVKEP